MKTEVKKIDNVQREISIEAGADIVKNKFEEVFTELGKKAKVKGFRPGHAPREIIEKNFSQQAHEQVVHELVPELYNKAIEKEALDVVALSEVFDVKLERNTIFFKARVEVMPEVALKNYKKIKVEYKKVAVTEDEVKRNIDALKEKRKIGSFNDETARGMGCPGLHEFEKIVERQILSQKDAANRRNTEQQIIDYLTKNADFKIPQTLVNKQLQELLRQAEVDLALRGFSKEQIVQQEENLSKELQPQAKKQVQIYLILSSIAKKENIPNDEQMPQKVMELLYKEADWAEAE